ncbi:uncharacterized protein MYCFIDRAFT_174464 [Pseudocercospora fijiensis CIRAD86]|uniref:Uncharacterized protein n=1 Tax=Pseudocercospora fijiensis (strain CIRAD86) TaxID=383855 RepID=M3B0M8_PSEFD|nr:uncharacterized protein MYCFIDRAFT_174464 [Pseudocercospora fijiensis CIRAD86]EME82963.1 hypothetical protein MYCFIDRAFT_174464 [Pseudocercospora fijiensis CIRAD86]
MISFKAMLPTPEASTSTPSDVGTAQPASDASELEAICWQFLICCTTSLRISLHMLLDSVMLILWKNCFRTGNDTPQPSLRHSNRLTTCCFRQEVVQKNPELQLHYVSAVTEVREKDGYAEVQMFTEITGMPAGIRRSVLNIFHWRKDKSQDGAWLLVQDDRFTSPTDLEFGAQQRPHQAPGPERTSRLQLTSQEYGLSSTGILYAALFGPESCKRRPERIDRNGWMAGTPCYHLRKAWRRPLSYATIPLRSGALVRHNGPRFEPLWLCARLREALAELAPSRSCRLHRDIDLLGAITARPADTRMALTSNEKRSPASIGSLIISNIYDAFERPKHDPAKAHIKAKGDPINCLAIRRSLSRFLIKELKILEQFKMACLSCQEVSAFPTSSFQIPLWSINHHQRAFPAISAAELAEHVILTSDVVNLDHSHSTALSAKAGGLESAGLPASSTVHARTDSRPSPWFVMHRGNFCARVVGGEPTT